MKIYNSLKIKKKHQNSVAAIGNFDGVHLGHQKVINQARQKAKKNNLPLGIITFEPMPALFFNKKIKNHRINSIKQKKKQLLKLKIDFLIIINFNKTFAKNSAEKFIEKIIFKKFKINYLFVSNNFKFGHKRKGNVNTLKKYEKLFNYTTIITSPLKKKSKIVSSTLIRKKISQGKIEEVNKLLSRNWSIQGKIIKGQKRGRKIGFPTCNMNISDYVIPKLGVYAVNARNSKFIKKGIANIGYKPTFNGQNLLLETNIFGFKQNLYNKEIEINFKKFIRPEKKFKTFEHLKKQIKLDVIKAKKMSKESLQLPKTAFSMKASLPTKEPQILEKWEKNKLYEKLRKISKGKEKFILHDGPPYANGHIHMGTALNKILKDMIIRFHQMSGKDSVYVPGWDCHGLPIEWKIEEQYKKKKKNKDDVPIKDFREECREFAKNWINIHIKEFKRLGVVGDFENYYSTMSNEAEAQIVRELGKFLLDGSLYQGYKPVLWSTVEKTALADAEVEYLDHTSKTIYAAFKVKDTSKDFLKDANIIIWTTTPWTIPANKALAYNSNIEYSVLEINELENFKDKKIVVANNLIETISKNCQIENFKVLKTFKGSDFTGTKCSHPFLKMKFDYDVPMLEASFVNLEQGTGIVHCAPSHGPDDFNLCLKNNIPSLYTVDNSGLYTKEIPYFSKTHIFKADDLVIEKLKESKKLLKDDRLNHSYPHSWRSKAPLIYRATPQWFISMKQNDLRNKAIKAINETVFYPKKGKDRLLSMIEGRPDWCVSRQRVWGVPLPIFINKKTKEPLKDQKVINRIASIYEKQGSDCWFTDDSKVFLGNDYDPKDYEKLNDIVEVWFDSGSTHSFVLEKRKDLKWPADMYLEGSDQHRGWFHSSLLESCGTRGKAPFESILSHGFVVDGKGVKMSKSLGNVISPEDILKNYGADILRSWVAASDYSEDIRIDKSILVQHAESYRKIRNTFRFMLGNLKDDYNKQDFEKLDFKKFDELEQFILHKIFIIDQSVKENLKSYNFHKLYKDLLSFCTTDLSSFYFDIRKDVLYCDSLQSQKRKNCVIVLNIVLECLLKWFAPILVFTTDEIHNLISKSDDTIHEHSFVKVPKKWENNPLNEKWTKLFKIKQEANIAIEEKRSNKIIGSSLEAELSILADEENFKLLSGLDLAEYFITSKADQIKSNKKDELKIEVKKANGSKCPRCWKILDKSCDRCQKVIKGNS